jgi:aryl-alcohol dehydrogenase-like predicted oxidoreductase
VTLFDTARGYGFGASDQLLPRALKGFDRGAVTMAIKGGLRARLRPVDSLTG